MLEMTIADAGAGLPATPRRRGLGSTLITALARQIGATVDTRTSPGAGTSIRLRMPLPVEPRAPDPVATEAVQAGVGGGC
jgi:two-component sensor histidine kinase